jgi:hypothetical protein
MHCEHKTCAARVAGRIAILPSLSGASGLRPTAALSPAGLI